VVATGEAVIKKVELAGYHGFMLTLPRGIVQIFVQAVKISRYYINDRISSVPGPLFQAMA
jgi:hypothetical protein